MDLLLHGCFLAEQALQGHLIICRSSPKEVPKKLTCFLFLSQMVWLERMWRWATKVATVAAMVVMLPIAIVVESASLVTTFTRVCWALRKARVGQVYEYRVYHPLNLRQSSLEFVLLPKGKYAMWQSGPQIDLVKVYTSKVAVADQCIRFFCSHPSWPTSTTLTVRSSWPYICDLMGRHASFRKVAADLDAAARTIQLTWRRSRERRRRRAALVIVNAALKAMYRPGGWRYGKIANHWAALTVGQKT
jgi:hypothetical protein